MTELPCAPELERAVLGACLVDNDAIADIRDILTPDVFYSEANAAVWRAISDLYDRRDPVDMLTAIQWLLERDKLSLAGGSTYISGLTNDVASGKNTHYHALLLVQYHIKRKVIRLGEQMIHGGSSPAMDPFDLLAQTGSEIRILNEYAQGDERTLADIMHDEVEDSSPDRGIPFGYEAIDMKMRAEPGTITIVGARPAMGKTSYALSGAFRQARMGYNVYFLELEMRNRNLARRLACGETGVSIWKMKRRKLEGRDREILARWHVENADATSRMLINEVPALTVSSLGARLDRAKRKHRIDVVWIDYIGLLQPSTRQRPGYDRMTAISNELRVLAKELDLPFIVLAQLSRPPKGASVTAPKLTDLRDSGEIEQDAEAVCFLHRPKYYDTAADDTLQFIMAKNRDGEDGMVNLWFDGPGIRVLDHPGEGNTAFSRPISTDRA